jgi:DegV family protein with EDD domain
MNKVVILVDSTCDLDPKYVSEHDIHILPLHVAFQGDPTDYLDGVNINSEQIYQKVEELGTTPKTGAMNCGELIDAFKPFIEEGCDIIFTGIGSTMSSTTNNAFLAAQEFPEGRIEVVDSMNLSTGIGLLVVKMVQYRDEGLDIHQIAEKVRPLVPKVSAKFCINQLDYLYKGGRCSGLALFAAKAFKIKPICKVIQGKLTVAKKSLGAYRKAIDLQVEELKRDLEANNVDTSCVFVTDSQRMEGDDDYAYEEVCKLIPRENVMRTHAGCVVSSHCGPKTIGILYILKEDMKK